MEEPSNATNTEFDLDTKIDILKHIHQEQWNEVNYRRDREYRIFTWSTNILLTLMAVLLVTKQTENIVWKPYGYWGNTVASLAIGVLVSFSIIWQFRTTRFRVRNSEVIYRIGRLLHCFDEGFFDDKENLSLYPKIWEVPEPKKLSYIKRLLFDANYASATLYLGILTIAMIWIPS
jgi:hypothetical protein